MEEDVLRHKCVAFGQRYSLRGAAIKTEKVDDDKCLAVATRVASAR
jgi:hypothetical protein